MSIKRERGRMASAIIIVSINLALMAGVVLLFRWWTGLVP